MPYLEIATSGRLARYIECYWARTAEAGEAKSVLPDGCADLLLTKRRGEIESLAAVGLMTTPLRVEENGERAYFGVRFRPGMCASFVPETPELTDRIEPLESFWGMRARRLVERLAESGKLSETIRIVEESLRPLEPPDAAFRAFNRLADLALPLDRLVSDAGLSPRHFRRACLARAGVSPKYLRRILRFRRSAEQIHSFAGLPMQPAWGQFAQARGYFDQAHFIREFQEFSGSTPGRFLQSLRTERSVELKRHEHAETGKPDRLY